MNIDICKNCNRFKILPVRFRCNKRKIYISHNKYFDKKFQKDGYLEDLSLKDTFFRREPPTDCPLGLVERKEEYCLNCEHFFQESVRVKCLNNNSSWSFIKFYSKQKSYDLCPYSFEQEMADLNECSHL